MYLEVTTISIVKEILTSTSKYYTTHKKSTLSLSDCVKGALDVLGDIPLFLSWQERNLFTDIISSTLTRSTTGVASTPDDESSVANTDQSFNFESMIESLYTDCDFGETEKRSRPVPIPLSRFRQIIIDIIPTKRVGKSVREFVEWLFVYILKRIVDMCEGLVEDGKTLTLDVADFVVKKIMGYQVFLI